MAIKANVSKQGIFKGGPIEKDGQASIYGDDIIIKPNLLRDSMLATAIPTNTSIGGCNNPTGYSFIDNSLKITATTDGNQNNGYGLYLKGISALGLSSGTQITFSIDVKGSGNKISIWFEGTDGAWWTGSNYHTYFTTLDQWTRLSVTGTVPTTVTNDLVMLGLHTGNAYSSGVTYFKNAKLEINNKATPWLPNSLDSYYTTYGFASQPTTISSPIEANNFIEI